MAPLDGLRAIAVMWVWGVHTLDEMLMQPYWACLKTEMNKYFFLAPLVNGDRGVDIFFVLSGFLISFVLFREFKKYSDIDVGHFLTSRFWRIWPVMFLLSVLWLPNPIYNWNLM